MFAHLTSPGNTLAIDVKHNNSHLVNIDLINNNQGSCQVKVKVQGSINTITFFDLEDEKTLTKTGTYKLGPYYDPISHLRFCFIYQGPNDDVELDLMYRGTN